MQPSGEKEPGDSVKQILFVKRITIQTGGGMTWGQNVGQKTFNGGESAEVEADLAERLIFAGYAVPDVENEKPTATEQPQTQPQG
jgi:hypothetical protein